MRKGTAEKGSPDEVLQGRALGLEPPPPLDLARVEERLVASDTPANRIVQTSEPDLDLPYGEATGRPVTLRSQSRFPERPAPPLIRPIIPCE